MKIDKGLAKPPPRKGYKSKYPWGELKVGDSFVYDGGPIDAAKVNCRYQSKKWQRKFEADILKGEVRVWRTE